MFLDHAEDEGFDPAMLRSMEALSLTAVKIQALMHGLLIASEKATYVYPRIFKTQEPSNEWNRLKPS